MSPRFLVRLWGGLLLGGAALLLSAIAFQETACACAVEGANAYQPTLAEINAAFLQAASNRLPSAFEPLPPIEVGTGSATQVATIPCVLLHAIAYVESSWHQARYPTARGASGPALVAIDCGYGVMQITSGMIQRDVGIPAAKQDRIAQEYAYNIAWGAKMLVEKWNIAPLWPYVSDRNPTIAEDWYFAIWAYNGFAYKNNPNNPDYPFPRVAFDGSQSRSNYPYQELVWGFAAHPRSENGTQLWSAVPLTLPDSGAIGACAYNNLAACPSPLARPTPSHISLCALSPRQYLPFLPKAP